MTPARVAVDRGFERGSRDSNPGSRFWRPCEWTANSLPRSEDNRLLRCGRRDSNPQAPFGAPGPKPGVSASCTTPARPRCYGKCPIRLGTYVRMRSEREVRTALALLAEGDTPTEVSKKTGIPRGTVNDWAQGRVPRVTPKNSSCVMCNPGFPLPEAEYAYLLGVYLGDASALVPGLLECDVVQREPEQLIKGLIESDGCRIVANDRGVPSVRYHFSNKSEDIKDIYCRALDAVGVRWTRPCSRQIAVYRKACAAELDQFIGPKS